MFLDLIGSAALRLRADLSFLDKHQLGQAEVWKTLKAQVKPEMVSDFNTRVLHLCCSPHGAGIVWPTPDAAGAGCGMLLSMEMC